jgi:outer membrane autotransporter protein
MKFRKSLLLGASAVALNAVLANAALACGTYAISGVTTVSGATDCVVWSGGTLSITSNGVVSGSSVGVSSSNVIGTLTNNGSISGTNSGVSNTGTIAGFKNTIGGFISSVNNLSGGTINNFSNSSGTIGSVSNASGGLISGNSAISNFNGGIGTITNTGNLVGTGGAGLNNGGTIGSFINNSGGSLTGHNTAILSQGGSIGTITNSGYIGGGRFAQIINYSTATIGSIGNSGTIGNTINGNTAINNQGHIGTISNSGSIIAPNDAIVNNSSSTIGVISNSNYISGTRSDVINSGSIGTVSNASGGTLSGHSYNIYNSAGTIGTITNSGTINAVGAAIYNSGGTIGSIVNNSNSTISSSLTYGIVNTNINSTITSLLNNGLISGVSAAIVDSGTIGTLTNNGTISGAVYATHIFTITGGNGTVNGTLTGGTITASGLVFDNNAYQLVNDNINLSGGTLTNNGHIQLNSGKSLTGVFAQAAAAVLGVGVTSSSNYGQLVVSGAATMNNSTVDIVRLGGNALFTGESFTVVAANSSGSSFTNVSGIAQGFNTSVTTSTSGGVEDLIITLGAMASATTFQQAGAPAGSAGSSMGSVLDQIQNNGNPAFTSLIGNISSLSGAAEANAIKSLAPNQVGAQVVANNISINPVTDIVQAHQYAMLGDGEAAGRAAGSEYRQGAFWGQMMGGDAIRSSDASTDGYRQEFYGLTVGADAQVTDSSILGTAFSWTQSNAFGSDASSGDKLQVDSYQLSGYDVKRWDRYYLNGLAGIAYNHFNQERYVVPVNQVAQSDYNGWQETARLEGGRNFAINQFTVTPLASLQAVYTQNQSYSESGAGIADLGVNKQYYDAYESDFGFRATTHLDTAWGALMPELKLAYVHDWTDNIVPTSGILGGVNFTTNTSGVSRNGAQLTLAATLESTDSLSLRAEYDGDYRSNYEASTAILKAAWKF